MEQEKQSKIFRLKPLKYHLPFTYEIIFRFFAGTTGYSLPFGRTCPDKVWIHKILATFDPLNGMELVLSADEYALHLSGLKGLLIANNINSSDAHLIQSHANSTSYSASNMFAKTIQDSFKCSLIRNDMISLKHKIDLERRKLNQQRDLFVKTRGSLAESETACLESSTLMMQIERIAEIASNNSKKKELTAYVFEQLGMADNFKVDPSDYLFILEPMIQTQIRLIEYELHLANAYSGNGRT